MDHGRGQGWSRRSLLRGAGWALASGALTQVGSACGRKQAGGSGASEARKVGAQPSPGEPSSPAPGALPREQRVGFALVGLGKLTLGELLPAFASCRFARPAALVSGDRAKAGRVAQQYGLEASQLYDYASFDRLQDDPGVQVVYVVLPNAMHAEFTVRAAHAGKHVLCEKPMANSEAECREMIAACDKARTQLMIAYRMQYEPFNREAIRMARAGELGVLKNFVSSNGQRERDLGEWRLKRALAGGGPLPDVGIYCLNAARYLSGQEPIEVSALMQQASDDPRFREVETQIDFSLRFPSGFMATCATSYDTFSSKSYRLLGDQGYLELDPAYAYRGQRMRIARAAHDGSELRVEPQIQPQNQFALEMDHMAQCVLHNRQPHTPGEEGLQDMRIIAAIYAAAASGRTVKLPQAEGLDVFRGPAPA